MAARGYLQLVPHRALVLSLAALHVAPPLREGVGELLPLLRQRAVQLRAAPRRRLLRAARGRAAVGDGWVDDGSSGQQLRGWVPRSGCLV